MVKIKECSPLSGSTTTYMSICRYYAETADLSDLISYLVMLTRNVAVSRNRQTVQFWFNERCECGPSLTDWLATIRIVSDLMNSKRGRFLVAARCFAI